LSTVYYSAVTVQYWTRVDRHM